MSYVIRWGVAAFIAAASTAHAQGDTRGYLTTINGQPVVTQTGQCVHTLEWQPGMHLANCDPVPAAPVAAVAEEPVEAAQPVPAPEVAEPAAQPAQEPVFVPVATSFRLSAETLFDFDRAALKPEGQAELDRLVESMASSNDQTIDIVGHTDRIGTPSYNQRLSERRAEAVRDYLVSRGVDASRISTRGVGNAESVVAKDECRGLPRAKLIACLQADRYAEVTVNGTFQSAASSTPSEARP